MSKYARLREFLLTASGSRVRLGFDKVEGLIHASLPKSAREYQAWWANDTSHAQAHAWLSAGWKMGGVDLKRGLVEFVRTGARLPAEPLMDIRSPDIPLRSTGERKNVLLLVVLSLGVWISPGAVDSEGVLSVRRLMTASEFSAAGLSKLTQSESAALDAWLVRYTDTLVRAATARPETHATSENSGYAVEVSHNDELFMINGEKFMAKTYCFNVGEGDRVIFIEGSPLGACVTATFVNLRTNDKCEVWCE